MIILRWIIDLISDPQIIIDGLLYAAQLFGFTTLVAVVCAVVVVHAGRIADARRNQRSADDRAFIARHRTHMTATTEPIPAAEVAPESVIEP